MTDEGASPLGWHALSWPWKRPASWSPESHCSLKAGERERQERKKETEGRKRRKNKRRKQRKGGAFSIKGTNFYH